MVEYKKTLTTKEVMFYVFLSVFFISYFVLFSEFYIKNIILVTCVLAYSVFIIIDNEIQKKKWKQDNLRIKKRSDIRISFWR